MLALALIPLASFLITLIVTPLLIPRFLKAGISGRDMNKAGKPEVAEMGGLAVSAGFLGGVLLAVALTTFNVVEFNLSLAYVLAVLCTFLLMALVGIVDDLIAMPQHVKAMLPLIAALPLMAVKAGATTMTLPLLGQVDFGVFYVLVLLPLGITGASNAMNMLAGFNGLEAGLGVIMCASVAAVAFIVNSVSALIISLAMAGALLAFLKYNWFPARIFIGDVGTLTIGAVVASSVIVGNIEKTGIILVLPFFLELFLKLRGRFREQSWCAVEGSKLVCRSRGDVYGWGRLVMYLSGGISERNLVLVILGVEALFGLAAVLMYL